MNTITVTLALPAQFVEHCRADHVEPGTVLRGFVGDLCGITDAEAGFVCNGERATDLTLRAGTTRKA
ncbi:MAG: hypothetical protein JF606_26320 [Burkholderiales bacterium]|nr:hypothetical protein [Burkholderiales bacterium]